MPHLSTFSLSLLAATTLFSGIAKAQETCTTAPTCLELGYTLTSTANCVGTPLKCPFDKTKYYCTQKSDAASAAMPDYSQASGRSINVTYTAATNGFIIGFDTVRASAGQGKDGAVSVYINNHNVKVNPGQVNWGLNNWSYPVKKGNTYRVESSGPVTETGYHFVPSN